MFITNGDIVDNKKHTTPISNSLNTFSQKQKIPLLLVTELLKSKIAG